LKVHLADNGGTVSNLLPN